jgi:RHS repeat-associated protein
MKKLLIVAPILVLLFAGGAHGLPASPQSDPGNAKPTWARRMSLPEKDNSVNASMALDSTGSAHFLQLVRDSLGVQRLYYFNNRIETRTTSGFSTREIVDQADSALSQVIGDPDIWVDANDTVHMVWTYWIIPAFPDPSQFKLVYGVRLQGGTTQTRVLGPDTEVHYATQIAVGDNGFVHITALEPYTDPDGVNWTRGVYFRLINGVLDPKQILFEQKNFLNPNALRMAAKGPYVCATWRQLDNPGNSDIYYVSSTNGGGNFTGMTRLTTTGFELTPDVDIEPNGTLHFAWLRTDSDPNVQRRIYHQTAGGTAEIAVPANANNDSPGSPRIRVADDTVHIFYSGFSHASKVGGSSWDSERPISAMGSDSTSAPSEAAIGAGRRLYMANEKYFAHSIGSNLPDGASWVPAFPGGSVNIVPINGSLQYRLNLFGTKGVGPCTSLGLTYNTKHAAASLVGPGWTMDHLMGISVPSDGEDIVLTLPNGLSINFTWDPALGYTVADKSFGFVGSIQRIGSTWTLVADGGTEYQFDTTGKLSTVMEPTGNYLQVQYSGGRPSAIVDQLGNGGQGRTTQLIYGTGSDASHIVRVVDPDGKDYILNYSPTFIGYQISSVVFPAVPFNNQMVNPIYSFQYGTNGCMSSVTMPRGNVYSIFYDSAGRVEHVEDPSEVLQLESEGDLASPISRTATFQVAYNNTTSFLQQSKFHSKVINRRGKESVYVFNASNGYGVIELWDAAALAGTVGIQPIHRTFDNFQNVLTLQDRWGFTTTYTYVPFQGHSNAPWLTNLLATVRKPAPGGVDEPVEDFAYTNDRFGNVQSHKTYAGGVARETTYDYDTFGRLTTTHFPNLTRLDSVPQNNVTTQNLYANTGRRQLVQTINEESHVTDFSNFDSRHGLPQEVLRQGGTQKEVTHYDLMGNVTETQRPQGGSGNEQPGFTVFGLDSLYRVRTVTDPANYVTTNEYDLESHLISVQPPAGGMTTTQYDKRGVVTGGSSPDGTWFQVVDANGNVRRKSSLRGFVTYSDYDSLDRVVAVRAPGATTQNGLGGGGSQMVTQWTHDGFAAGVHFSTQTRVGAPDYRITRTLYDNRQRPVKVIAPDDNTVTETFYDEQDHVVATQLSINSTVQTATLTFRDNRDRVERVRVQQGAYGQASGPFADTVTLLNRVGSVVVTRDPLWNPAFPLAHTMTQVLDARERVVQVLDGLGQVVRENVWGDDDLLVETKIPDPATKTATLVRSEIRTYTKRKEPKTVLNRDANGLSYLYNALQGQVDTVTDTLNRVTKTTYDLNTQRVDEVIVAQGSSSERRTKSVWTNGLLIETRVWNPTPGVNAYTSSYFYSYDEADRLERFQAPLVADERHKFNEFGEEFQFIAGNKTITHTYNTLGQRVSSQWSGPAYNTLETRTYNSIGLLATVDNGSLRKEMLYDVWHGTPALETFKTSGQTWRTQLHTSDAAKNYISLSDTAGGLHEWSYDENNRVHEILYNGKAVCTVAYTVGGLVDKTTLRKANGDAIAETTHSYDGLGRKIRQQTVITTHQTLADFEWEYNTLDLVTAIKVNHLAVRADLLYNERRELTQEAWTGNSSGQAAPSFTNPSPVSGGVTQSVPSNEAEASLQTATSVAAITKAYTYDPAGNRKTSTVGGVQTDYTYNAASQLVSEHTPAAGGQPVRDVAHAYTDGWGNETSRVTTTGGTPVTETYVYNYLNLLSSYTKGSTVSEQYDFWPTGERYAKRNLITTSDQELYVPRFGDVTTEYSDPNTLKNSYVQGTGIDSKCTRIPFGSSERRHYLGDSVGTVSVTLSDLGVVSESSLKDVWGVQISGGTSERYGFAQREQDAESGLVHMRARQYDPRIGRFTQTDPVRGNRPFEHYAYAGNNPVSMVDPMGLAWWSIGDAWEGVKSSAAKAGEFAKSIYRINPLTAPYRLGEAVLADRGNFVESTEYVFWGGAGKALVADAEKRGQVLMQQGKMDPYSAGIVGSAGAVTDSALLGIPSTVETLLDPDVDFNTKADAASNGLFSLGVGIASHAKVKMDTAQSPVPLGSVRTYQEAWGRLAAAERAEALQAALPAGSKGRITMAAGYYFDAQGQVRIAVASSEPGRYLRPSVAAAKYSWEKVATGVGDAETKLFSDFFVEGAAAGRPVCGPCQTLLNDAGIEVLSERKR